MSIKLPIQVIACETDFGGVVSNVRYVEYLERGRYALLHAAGLTLTRIWEQHGVQPVVRQVQADYLGMARHEEELVLEVTVARHTRTTTDLDFVLRRQSDGAVVLRARQILAYLNTRWRPVRVPQIFRDALPAEKDPT